MIKISSKGYPVYIGDILGELCRSVTARNYSSVFILTDENTNKFCLPALRKSKLQIHASNIIRIPAGEQGKTIRTVEYLWKKLLEGNADRNSVLINIGGGVVTDLGGFAAATFKRGIDFIHVPTTLLCMADACIGGKTGIDFHNIKNVVGAFKNPQAVFIYPEFLKTLPADEYKSGLAEVIKHGLISGKKKRKELFQLLKKSETPELSAAQIAVTIKTKLAIVENDPNEKNIRRILNFGHTVGHALESWLMKKGEKTFHGYCVAAGMIIELQLSEQLARFPLKDKEEIVQVIQKIFPVISFTKRDIPAIIKLMEQDKKNASGKIGFVLINEKGQMEINRFIEKKEIRNALNEYLVLQ